MVYKESGAASLLRRHGVLVDRHGAVRLAAALHEVLLDVHVGRVVPRRVADFLTASGPPLAFLARDMRLQGVIKRNSSPFFIVPLL